MSAKAKRNRLRATIVTAVMGAVGAVLMFLEFPIPIMPSFVKFDFSELPALITAFAFGPLYGVAVCLIKNAVHLFAGSTMGVGELSNFVLGAILSAVAGAVYRKKKTRVGALIGAASGSLLMAIVSVFTNYYIVYPIYAKLFIPMEVIVSMYQDIFSGTGSLFQALLIFNLPFNFAKGLICAAICFLIYKPLTPIIKGAAK